jgi:Ca2+:H+ antiporter
MVGVGVALVLVPSVPGWTGDPERHTLVVATVPVAAVLLAIYAVVTIRGLRRHKRLHAESGSEAHEDAWGLPLALAVLAAATLATAFVSEVLVGSLDEFAHTVGLSEFAIAAVVVAAVGNAAEHGGSIVIARRGKTELASEIAVSSSAQVLMLVTPLVALLSLAFAHPLPLAFRPLEIGALAGATLLAAAVVARGRVTRVSGWLLLTGYVTFVVLALLASDR